MDGAEVPHLIFRWLHVLAGVMWVGQLWSLAAICRLPSGQSVDPSLGPVALRAHNWLRWAAIVTWITGLPLLGIVYYNGGALTDVQQSLGLAAGVGLASLFVAWIAYDAVWVLLARHALTAMLVTLALLTATSPREQPSADLVAVAAVRMRHNVALSVAVILFMVSNHFPLVYGHALSWLVAPGIVVVGWLVSKALYVRTMSPVARHA